MVQMIKPPVVDGKCTLTILSEISFFETMVDDVNHILNIKQNLGLSELSFSSLELFAIMVLQSADCLTGLD